MFKNLLSLTLFLSFSIYVQANFMPAIEGNDEPSTVFFDLEECLSNGGVPGSASDYSEFTADISNTSECAALSVIGDNLYRDNPSSNMHSCSPGVDGSIAMCVGISQSCDIEQSVDKAIKFDIQLDVINNTSATLSSLRFFENAPETFSWINGPTGDNNYPTLYGIRVYSNGTLLFEETEVATEQEWNEEVYIFAGIESFTVTETTIFNFELIPYCPIGNGASVAAWDVDNITILAGCDPVLGGDISFEDGSESVEICAGDGEPDPLDVTLENNVGPNSQWVITDADGVILDLPAGPPFDLDGAGAGVCLIWHLSFADGLIGAEVGLNANDMEGCFDLSNSLTVTRFEVDGGVLSFEDGTDSITICAGDGEPDPLAVTLTDENGDNSAWVITDTEGNILALPSAPPFDLDGAGPGTCLIWHLSFADGLIGAEVGLNANDLEGCFDLSNAITVIREEAEGGEISFDDNLTEITICAGDGVADPLNVDLEGNSGDN